MHLENDEIHRVSTTDGRARTGAKHTAPYLSSLVTETIRHGFREAHVLGSDPAQNRAPAPHRGLGAPVLQPPQAAPHGGLNDLSIWRRALDLPMAAKLASHEPGHMIWRRPGTAICHHTLLDINGRETAEKCRDNLHRLQDFDPAKRAANIGNHTAHSMPPRVRAERVQQTRRRETKSLDRCFRYIKAAKTDAAEPTTAPGKTRKRSRTVSPAGQSSVFVIQKHSLLYLLNMTP